MYPGRSAAFYRYDGSIHLSYATALHRSSADARAEATLIHEASHAFTHAITRQAFQMLGLPSWFIEGLATYLEYNLNQNTILSARPRTARILGPLAAEPYHRGYQAIEYLIDRHGPSAFPDVLERTGNGTPFPDAFKDAFRMTIPELDHYLRTR